MNREQDFTLQLLKLDSIEQCENTARFRGRVKLTNFEEGSAVKYSTLCYTVDFF